MTDLPDQLQISEKCRAGLALLRVRGRPCGQAVVRLDQPDNPLLPTILAGADSAFWEAWLRCRLGLDASYADRPSTMSVSVAVCTRDRPEDLKRCIDALLRMPDDGQEILVIDNAPSSDATAMMIQQMSRIRYVREDRPGLNVARNRALEEARGELVLFTDDDAAPDPLWLRRLARNFDDPLVLASTGLTMALELSSAAQIDFQRYGGFVRGFKRVVYDAAEHDPLLAWHAGAGVNMAIRRSAVQLVGSFDEAFDAGTPTHAGGDSEMFRRILSAGYRIVYDPEALNWHRHRKSADELRRQLFGYEVAGASLLTKAFFVDGDIGALREAVRWLKREIRFLFRAVLGRPNVPSFSVSFARFSGGLVGPFLYLRSRRQVR
ncbi:glycosyltransferase family 2 protein [Bradyrhizobium glycinis]|uniref:glycosyltransferase family 2 protein n=1 Tax=Bradyrhizobium glycinis TaxID=2751812 RepID=UPI001FE6B518|nr:glycosyltransferase [Bradyrhizobium glycinis]